MQVQIRSHDHRITPHDREKLDHVFAHLERMVAHYPAPHLHVHVQRTGHHTDECEVRMALGISKRRIVADHRAATVVAAAQACVDLLARKIQHAHERVHSRHGERRIRHAKEEAAMPDMEALRAAVAANDYVSFRDALREVPEALEAEIGRRLKFHPDAEALLGDTYVIADLVEAVVHRAFETFAARPGSGLVHDWMVSLIDPVIDDLTPTTR